MQESEILFQVSQIVSWSDSFREAVKQVHSLLGRVLGAQEDGGELGLPQRVWNYVGEQLGMLQQRTRLSQERMRLEAELATLREDLATRKAVQRAMGILGTRRGMTPASAKLWISEQSRQTRQSAKRVAEQVVAMENAQRRSLSTSPRRQQIASMHAGA